MAQKRISRKQLLKEPDEFISTSTKLLDWAKSNPKKLIYGVSAFVALVLAASGYTYYYQARAKAAANLLSQSLAKYETMAGKDKAAALAAVKPDFKKLVDKFGGQPASVLGRIIFGHISLAGHDPDEAIALYKRALEETGDDPALTNLILNGLAAAYEQKGQTQEAIAYDEKIKAGNSSVLKDAALFSLGRLYEKIGQKEKSIQAYEQLSNDFPESMYAEIAREMAAQETS